MRSHAPRSTALLWTQAGSDPRTPGWTAQLLTVFAAGACDGSTSSSNRRCQHTQLLTLCALLHCAARAVLCYAVCRLAAKGLLDDIRADWEECQMDMTLQQLRQTNANAAAQASKAAAAASGACAGAAGGNKARRGRGDVDEQADVSVDEPRRVSVTVYC